MVHSLAYIIPNESHFQSGVAITTPFSAQKPPFQLKSFGGGSVPFICIRRYASRGMENLVTISRCKTPPAPPFRWIAVISIALSAVLLRPFGGRLGWLDK